MEMVVIVVKAQLYANLFHLVKINPVRYKIGDSIKTRNTKVNVKFVDYLLRYAHDFSVYKKAHDTCSNHYRSHVENNSIYSMGKSL